MVNSRFLHSNCLKTTGFASSKKYLIYFELNTRLPRLILRMGLGFRCSFRVGIGILLVVRLGQRPQVGRTTLLSALVRAYKSLHRARPDASPAFRFFPG